MKTSFLKLLFALILSVGPLLAQTDDRLFGRLSHSGPGERTRTASVHLSFNSKSAEGFPSVPAGSEARTYLKVWDDLHLQVATRSGERGVLGYVFSFSKDEEGRNSLSATEPFKGWTPREVAASDFRTKDNYGSEPIKTGPATAESRGPFRVLHYPDFDAEVRVLEFSIGDAKLGKEPFFKAASFLVTVREKEAKKASAK